MFMDNFFETNEANGSVSPPTEEKPHSIADGWVDRYDAVPRASPRSMQLEPFITAPLVPTPTLENSEDLMDLAAIQGLQGQLQSSVAAKEAEHALILENDSLLDNIRESLSPVRQLLPSQPPPLALADDLAAVRALARARWLQSQECIDPPAPPAANPGPQPRHAPEPPAVVPVPAVPPPSAAPAELAELEPVETVGIVLQLLNAEKVAMSISLGASISDLRQAAAARLGRAGAARADTMRMFFLGRELRDASMLLRELGLSDGSVVQVAPERASVASAPAVPAHAQPEWAEDDDLVRPADEAYEDTLLPDADAVGDADGGYFGLGFDEWQHPPQSDGAGGWNPTQASMNGHHHEQAPRGHIRNRPSSRTTASAAASAASAAAQLVERAQMMSAAADRMRFGSGPSQHAASMQWQQLYAGRNAAPAPRPFGTLPPPSAPTPLQPAHAARDVRQHTYGTSAHGPHPHGPPLGMRPSPEWERFFGGSATSAPRPAPARTPAAMRPHAPPAALQHAAGLGFDDDVQRLLRAAFNELGRDALIHTPHPRAHPLRDASQPSSHSPAAPRGLGSFDDDVQRMLSAAFHELAHDAVAHAPLLLPVA